MTTSTGIHRGTVLWFSDAKGYGFITPEEGSRDVYVHYSAIDSQQKRRKLLPEQNVEFEVVESDKGPMAANVRVVL